MDIPTLRLRAAVDLLARAVPIIPVRSLDQPSGPVSISGDGHRFVARASANASRIQISFEAEGLNLPEATVDLPALKKALQEMKKHKSLRLRVSGKRKPSLVISTQENSDEEIVHGVDDRDPVSGPPKGGEIHLAELQPDQASFLLGWLSETLPTWKQAENKPIIQGVTIRANGGWWATDGVRLHHRHGGLGLVSQDAMLPLGCALALAEAVDLGLESALKIEIHRSKKQDEIYFAVRAGTPKTGSLLVETWAVLQEVPLEKDDDRKTPKTLDDLMQKWAATPEAVTVLLPRGDLTTALKDCSVDILARKATNHKGEPITAFWFYPDGQGGAAMQYTTADEDDEQVPEDSRPGLCGRLHAFVEPRLEKPFGVQLNAQLLLQAINGVPAECQWVRLFFHAGPPVSDPVYIDGYGEHAIAQSFAYLMPCQGRYYDDNQAARNAAKKAVEDQQNTQQGGPTR